MKSYVKKQKIIQIISVLVCILGIGLLSYMITVESEPGALPLLMVIVGAIGILLTRNKQQSLKK